jgi:hypothetical protein
VADLGWGRGAQALPLIGQAPPPPTFFFGVSSTARNQSTPILLISFPPLCVTDQQLSIPDQTYPIICNVCNVSCACHVHLMSMLPAQPCTQRHSVFKSFSKIRLVRLSITSSICSCVKKHYNIPASAYFF